MLYWQLAYFVLKIFCKLYTILMCFILPGLVTTLHGLNIANNPLEFPPESVVEGGTKSILAFFRDLLRAKNEAGYGGPGDYFSKKAYQMQIEVLS